VPASAIPQLGSGTRFAILLAFAAIGPGAAVACLIQLGDAVSAWAMASVLSVALGGVIADLMVWTHQWHPAGGYLVLAAPTVATAVVVLMPGWRSRGQPSTAATVSPPPPVSRQASPQVSPQVSPQASRFPPLSARPGRNPVGPGVRRPDFDATALMPRITNTGPSPRSGAGLDSTMHLPMIVEPRGPDETVMLPMLRINDATTVLPVLRDETALLRLPVPRQPPPDEVLMGAIPAADQGWNRRSVEAAIAEVALLVALVGVWLFSLSRTSTANLTDYGLLPAIHPAFFVALGLCILRFVLELGRERWRWWVLVGHTLLLVFIMHATVPILITNPEYFWTYRHIGVMNGFREYGQVTDSTDIYQQWPTFFAFAAHLIDGSGAAPLNVAAWAPVFFDLAYCLPIFAIARTLSTDKRVPYLTVFLFQAVNWVAQDYFAPQAFAYLLCLGTLLILVRWLRRTTGPNNHRTPGRIAKLWGWVGNGLAEVPYTSKNTRRVALAALYLMYAVVVASHQLSPYLIAMSAGALVVLGLIRPLRIIPILLSIAILYLVPRYGIVESYGLFDGFNFFSNAQTNSPLGGASAGRLLSGQVAQFLSLSVWGLAALTVVASRRRLGPVAAPAVLAFTPFGLLLAQSYGGEAIYRVYFFSIPWCAYLIATLVLRKRWVPRGLAAPAAAMIVLAAVLGCFQARHGHLSFNQFTPEELAASEYIYTHAEPNAEVMVVASAFPNRFTANSGSFQANRSGARELLTGNDDNELVRLKLTADDLPTINATFDADRPTYLIFGPAMAKYLHYFGYAPDGLIDTLHKTISSSPNWGVYYRNGDVTIYKYFPSPP
jgi:hypothetical protein